MTSFVVIFYVTSRDNSLQCNVISTICGYLNDWFWFGKESHMYRMIETVFERCTTCRLNLLSIAMKSS